MQMSEEMEMVVARGIINNGRVTPAIIKSIYSAAISGERCASILRKIETLGYIRSTKYFGIFMVRVKEIKIGSKKKLVWAVPQEIIDMSNNLQDIQSTAKDEDDLLKKYKKTNGDTDISM
ncbi:MAG: hypothetical protein KAK00_00285 [Nanoarchaeota archaeon]|nr:hypothetical protein [Nanoarchaeota archaeon]